MKVGSQAVGLLTSGRGDRRTILLYVTETRAQEAAIKRLFEHFDWDYNAALQPNQAVQVSQSENNEQ